MIRDCAGLDEAEDVGEDESAGPGESGSATCGAVGSMPAGLAAEDGTVGREGRRCLFCERGEAGTAPGLVLKDPAVLPVLPTCAVVPEEEFRDG